MSLIAFGLTGVVIYKWYKYGKDFEKRVPTVEFYPPDNLNSAEIGYIYNNRQATKKLTISLIIQLASKGYIKIDEIKGGLFRNSKIKITKLSNRPQSHKSVSDKVPSRQIVVRKLKESDSNISSYANQMMAYMFKNADVKLIREGNRIEEFDKVKGELLSKGYIKIISDISYDDISKENGEIFKGQIESYNKAIDDYNNYIGLDSISGMEKFVYDKLFEFSDEIILSEHKTFYQIFSQVANELEDRFGEKINDMEAKKQRYFTIIITILSLFITILSYTIIEDLSPRLSFLYYLSFLCIPINVLFIIIMARKTDYGEVVSAQIEGFRNFLLTAEKEQLEDLVAKNPHYFYNILPYTYVLNISKKWIRKFEDIPMPKIDIGNFNYNSSTAFNSIYTDVYYPPASHSSSSGCSSCGGGCSSCGGGCSSCGGGGSW